MMNANIEKIFVHPKPNIVLSKCLGISACRYNGHIILDKIIDAIAPYMNFIAVCPEEEIGLGTPRNPIRLENQNESIRLVQAKTGKDITNKMITFSKIKSNEYYGNIDGLILKDRLPSCGINNVKVYSSKHGMVTKKSMGMFAEMMKESFPEIPMENEGRLSNKELREHFLTRVFTLARYRLIIDEKNIKELQLFHQRHKYLLMGYNQRLMRELGKIVANSDKKEYRKVYSNYYNLLLKVFNKMPRKNSIINIYLHNFGYFKNELKSSEKVMFLELIEKYRNKIVTASTISHLLLAWIVRHNEKYLINQYFFQPFPEDLVSLPDSGRNRNLE